MTEIIYRQQFLSTARAHLRGAEQRGPAHPPSAPYPQVQRASAEDERNLRWLRSAGAPRRSRGSSTGFSYLSARFWSAAGSESASATPLWPRSEKLGRADVLVCAKAPSSLRSAGAPRRSRANSTGSADLRQVLKRGKGMDPCCNWKVLLQIVTRTTWGIFNYEHRTNGAQHTATAACLRPGRRGEQSVVPASAGLRKCAWRPRVRA